ncbi:MAG: prefoldin subunit alpha [Candidatus Methanoplasma sp.]|jgi:prefoldin alpha subunit|nr:prefoldin subunit alpha [Candidatus Methanoplasma sp.]
MKMEDNELRQAMAVLDTYNAQLEALNRQVRLLQVSLEDATRARESFKALADAEEGDEILIPVGASSFVPAKVTGKKKAIVGIGNRFSAEKDMDEAVTYMDKMVNDVSEALRSAIGTLNEIEAMATELTMTIQNEYRNRQLAMQ